MHADARGWFKEAWQREKLAAAGLPDLGPVQANVSYNRHAGATRGLHAEPWDKYVTLATGRAFAAWVDLRPGETFGTSFWIELDPSIAVFVPRGVANSYQTLADDCAYTYLVNDHWRPGIAYPAVNLADPELAIPWPIALSEAEISEKDLANPSLAQAVPMAPKKTLIIGAGGQLANALAREFPVAETIGIEDLDLTDAAAVSAWPWHEYDVVLNAAAYTAVDNAETPEGRRVAWAVNATAPATLARHALQRRITLVHYSTEYVFDGTQPDHVETEPVAPLGVYAQSKAAGDLAVSLVPRHYILRTSWLIGDGPNFVRTMWRLARDGVNPSVVADQTGRLTFASELAAATRHLLDTRADHGIYHVTNDGPAQSWHQIAARVFELAGRDPSAVTAVTTAEYEASRGAASSAPRPLQSTMDLNKLLATGYQPRHADDALVDYCKAHLASDA